MADENSERIREIDELRARLGQEKADMREKLEKEKTEIVSRLEKENADLKDQLNAAKVKRVIYKLRKKILTINFLCQVVAFSVGANPNCYASDIMEFFHSIKKFLC